MLYYELQVKSFLHKFPKVDPGLDVVKGRRRHSPILKHNFAQLHELIDLNSFIVIVI